MTKIIDSGFVFNYDRNGKLSDFETITSEQRKMIGPGKNSSEMIYIKCTACDTFMDYKS